MTNEAFSRYLARLRIHAERGEVAICRELAEDRGLACLRDIADAFAAGDSKAAVAMILANKEPASRLTLDTAIADSPLGVRVGNALEDFLGIVTFGDLQNVGEELLLQAPNVGKQTVHQIRSLLATAVKNSAVD